MKTAENGATTREQQNKQQIQIERLEAVVSFSLVFVLSSQKLKSVSIIEFYLFFFGFLK